MPNTTKHQLQRESMAYIYFIIKNLLYECKSWFKFAYHIIIVWTRRSIYCAHSSVLSILFALIHKTIVCTFGWRCQRSRVRPWVQRDGIVTAYQICSFCGLCFFFLCLNICHGNWNFSVCFSFQMVDHISRPRSACPIFSLLFFLALFVWKVPYRFGYWYICVIK